jgi:hypothetical protein
MLRFCSIADCKSLQILDWLFWDGLSQESHFTGVLEVARASSLAFDNFCTISLLSRMAVLHLRSIPTGPQNG